MEDRIMRTQEVATYLKINAMTLKRLAKEGRIPSIQIGTGWRFSKTALDEWLARGGELVQGQQ